MAKSQLEIVLVDDGGSSASVDSRTEQAPAPTTGPVQTPAGGPVSFSAQDTAPAAATESESAKVKSDPRPTVAGELAKPTESLAQSLGLGGLASQIKMIVDLIRRFADSLPDTVQNRVSTQPAVAEPTELAPVVSGAMQRESSDSDTAVAQPPIIDAIRDLSTDSVGTGNEQPITAGITPQATDSDGEPIDLANAVNQFSRINGPKAMAGHVGDIVDGFRTWMAGYTTGEPEDSEQITTSEPVEGPTEVTVNLAPQIDVPAPDASVSTSPDVITPTAEIPQDAIAMLAEQFRQVDTRRDDYEPTASAAKVTGVDQSGTPPAGLVDYTAADPTTAVNEAVERIASRPVNVTVQADSSGLGPSTERSTERSSTDHISGLDGTVSSTMHQTTTGPIGNIPQAPKAADEIATASPRMQRRTPGVFGKLGPKVSGGSGGGLSGVIGRVAGPAASTSATAATTTAGAAATSGATAAAAGGASAGGGLAGLVAAAGPAAIAIGAIAAVSVAAVAGVKKLISTFNEQADLLAGYSAEISAAQAEVDVRMELAQMDRAEKIGPQLADFTRDYGDFQERLYDLGTEFLGVFLELWEWIQPVLDRGLSMLEIVVAIVRIVKETADEWFHWAQSDDEAMKEDRKQQAEAARDLADAFERFINGQEEKEDPIMDPFLQEFFASTGQAPLQMARPGNAAP